jgi:hypothetical protein
MYGTRHHHSGCNMVLKDDRIIGSEITPRKILH